MYHVIKSFLKNNLAIGAIEYSLIGTVISVGVLGATTGLGDQLENTFECVVRTIGSDDDLCHGATLETTNNITNGWSSNLVVKAGDKYEITVPENFQFTIWNKPKAWFNPDENHSRYKNIGLSAAITDTPIAQGQYVSAEEGSNQIHYQSLDNFATFKDSKITIEVQNDGFLNVGVLDINSSDNWTTTDGGVTKSRDLGVTITRVN